MAESPESYHPRDTLANTARTTMQLSVVGAILAGTQNALAKQNVGAMGIITRSGHVIALYGMHGGT
jgi:hypothetical protein